MATLRNDGGTVTGVVYVDGQGNHQTAVADAYVLAASAIESARLCLLSPTPGGGALGNSSGQVGQNLMFHFQTNVNGFFPRRVHGQRGLAVTSGLSDFRGVEPADAGARVFATRAGPRVFLGGICEFRSSHGLTITETATSALPAPAVVYGQPLKNALRDQPLGQHTRALMQGEDAPQRRTTHA